MKKDLNIILSHTTLVGDCLEWTKCFNTDGYPRAVIDGNNNAKVHRVVWELSTGKSACNLVVRHTCDNPKCINPNHLEIGTSQDNNQDMVKRSRYNSKLNPEKVRLIRKLAATNEYSQKELANLFNVNSRTINSLVLRKHWKHVE